MISTLIHQNGETPVLIKGLKIGICFCGYFRCATRVCLKYTGNVMNLIVNYMAVIGWE